MIRPEEFKTRLGVNVGQEELSVADARRILGPDKWIGVSTHWLDQAQAAVLAGADYIGVSIGPGIPVWPLSVCYAALPRSKTPTGFKH